MMRVLGAIIAAVKHRLPGARAAEAESAARLACAMNLRDAEKCREETRKHVRETAAILDVHEWRERWLERHPTSQTYRTQESR